MLVRLSSALIAPLLLCLSVQSRAETCVSTNGGATLEELAGRLQQALASADADALKPLVVDECAWKRAQWLMGNDKAERLATVARSDRLAKEHESLRKWLERKNVKLPAVLDGVALERNKKGIALLHAGDVWIELEFETVEIDGRWYLSDDKLDFDPAHSPTFSRFEDAIGDLSATLAAREALEHAGAKRAVLATFETWKSQSRVVVLAAAREIPRTDAKERRAAVAEVYRAFAPLSADERRDPSVAGVLRELGDVLGVKWDFEHPTGDRDSDNLIRRALKCANSAVGRSMAYHVGFLWLDSPLSSTTCQSVLKTEYKDACPR